MPPSEARTRNPSSDVIRWFWVSGTAITACSSGSRSLFCLYFTSLRLRVIPKVPRRMLQYESWVQIWTIDTAMFNKATCPHNVLAFLWSRDQRDWIWKELDAPGMLVVWSQVRSLAWPLLQITARESPTLPCGYHLAQVDYPAKKIYYVNVAVCDQHNKHSGAR